MTHRGGKRLARQADAPTDRVEYFDLLRVLASFAVVVLHISAQNWATLGPDTAVWRVFNLYDSMVRWSVPVFVMISGALFLEHPPTWEKLWQKHILRIVTAFTFWTLVYALISYVRDGTRGPALMRELLHGHYHMWFLFTIVGLYLIVPFLSELVKSEKLVRYFLLLSLLETFLLPQIDALLAANAGDGAYVLDGMLSYLRINFVLGFTGYFLLGWYLHKKRLSKRAVLAICVMGVLGFASTILFTQLWSLSQGEPSQLFYGFLNTNVLMEAVVVFVLAKQLCRGHGTRLLAALSKYSFGAYLVHALVIETLERHLGLTTMSFAPVLAVPVISLLVLAISYALSWALHFIPRLGKYIV